MNKEFERLNLIYNDAKNVELTFYTIYLSLFIVIFTSEKHINAMQNALIVASIFTVLTTWIVFILEKRIIRKLYDDRRPFKTDPISYILFKIMISIFLIGFAIVIRLYNIN